MLKLKLAKEAKKDIKAIGRYTQKQWGEAQRRVYIRSLYDRFEWLIENPGLGKNRSDIHEGYYSYHEGKHQIFYIIDNEILTVIGVLHENMDFQQHL